MEAQIAYLERSLQECIREIRVAEESLALGHYANRNMLQADIDRLNSLKDSILRQIGQARGNGKRRIIRGVA